MKGKPDAARRFLSGLALTLSAILLAVLLPALNEGLFARALTETVDAGLQGNEGQLRGFARETIGYIDGRLPAWSPTIVAADGAIPVSRDFAAHMAEVRRSAAAGKLACGGCAALGLALLGWAWAQRGRCENAAHRRHFLATRAYYLGAALPLTLTLALCLWAALDFGSFWDWLHRAFIPGGIFDAGEPIMRLFPLKLFGAYLAPVAIALAAALAAVAALPLLGERIGRMRKSS